MANLFKNEPVYIEDADINSKYFNIREFPEILTSGKNSFFLSGTSKLRQNSTILIQILDVDDNQIDFSIPNILLNGTDYLISINVPENIKYGFGNITILGELIDVPKKWQNKYNVKWSKSILINPTVDNLSKVIFYKNPKIIFKEIYDTSQSISNIKYTQTTISGSNLFIEIGSNTDGLKYSEGYIINTDYNENFSSEIIGGNLFVSSSNITASIYGEIEYDPSLYTYPDYNTTILSILNKNSLIVKDQYFRTNNITKIQENISILPTSYSISYNKQETFYKPNIRNSYLEVSLNNISTVSGKIKFVELYRNPGNIYIGKYDLTSYKMLSNITNTTSSWILDSSGSLSDIKYNNITNTRML